MRVPRHRRPRRHGASVGAPGLKSERARPARCARSAASVGSVSSAGCPRARSPGLAQDGQLRARREVSCSPGRAEKPCPLEDRCRGHTHNSESGGVSLWQECVDCVA
eukprot:13198838-Alexandrium_andersonii.AAC.1